MSEPMELGWVFTVFLISGVAWAFLATLGLLLLADRRRRKREIASFEAEMRDVLQNQTLSFINLPVKPAMTAEEAQQLLGKHLRKH